MVVVLLRHAEAVDERRDLPDAVRYLTAVGRAQAVAVGQQCAGFLSAWLGSLGAPAALDAIHWWTSPLVRAVQTTELAVAGSGAAGVQVSPLLAPGADVSELAALVRRAEAIAVSVWVGHEPGLSALGAELTGDLDFALLDKAEAVALVAGKVCWRWSCHAPAPTFV